jgi:hypothetical protein
MYVVKWEALFQVAGMYMNSRTSLLRRTVESRKDQEWIDVFVTR